MTARGDQISPGEMLQQARKASGLSLAEMAEKTKIPPRLLAAIELDDYQKVAEPLYVKSFLRTYANCLQLDTQEILDLYNRRAGTYVPSLETDQIWEEDVQVRRVGQGLRGQVLRWVGLAAVLLLVAILVGRGLRGQQKEDAPDSLADQVPETAQGGTVAAPVAEASAPVTSAGNTAAGVALPGADPQVASEEILPPQDTQTETAQEAIPSRSQAMRLAMLQLDSLLSSWDAVPEESQASPARTTAGAYAEAHPHALRGDASLLFAGSRQWPLVLRVLTSEPVAVSIKADGQTRLVPVRWPPQEAQSLPASGIEPGRVYAVAQGYAMYWGARDHFYLLLSSRDAVQVSLNGIAQPIPERNVGREWMLDADALASGNPE